ncbi:MAG: hypothetical protein MJZ54_07710 [Bacteroidaceae bacterium]|nr:hypothetical protein [Bacteroidaceae bacterium]
MTKEEERILHQFEAKVRTLVEKHRALKKENDELYALVDERDRQIKTLTAQKQQAEGILANYKAGRMLELTSGDIEEARRRVASMIREIDKCIALLNV